MKIGVLLLDQKVNRGNRDNSFDKLPYHGFKHILSELSDNYSIISPSQIRDYDYCLCSITSVMDIENLIYTFERHKPNKDKCKVIVGGFGCINIWAIYDYIDIAVFGRAEGQINDILLGVELENVWRKEDDPDLLSIYKMRQMHKLIGNEQTVGCRNKCTFCQYSHIRLYTGGKNYDAVDVSFIEDDWRGLQVTGSGRYVTAWDGLSEQTRRRVKKKVTDQQIKDKMLSWYDVKREKAINIKIFNIVGYPWETKQTVISDLLAIKDIFKSCDLKKGGAENRVLIMMMFTPFSPEPLTPMGNCKPNIDIIWRAFFNSIGRQVYKGIDFECFILPQINSSYTLAKRVMINRATRENRKHIQIVLKNKKIDSLKSAQQIKALKSFKHTPDVFKEGNFVLPYLKV